MRKKFGILASMLVLATLLIQTHGYAAEKRMRNPAANKENVSTMNDKLVKVGDQNQYLLTYKTWNISTNPIGWILGSYGIAVTHALTPNVGITADINYVDDVFDVDAKGLSFGVTVPVYFRKIFSEYFIEPGLTYQSLEISDTDVKVYGPTVLFGKHWFWDSGLNISAALGFGRNWSDKKKSDVEEIEDVTKVFATGYLRFGYAF